MCLVQTYNLCVDVRRSPDGSKHRADVNNVAPMHRGLLDIWAPKNFCSSREFFIGIFKTF